MGVQQQAGTQLEWHRPGEGTQCPPYLLVQAQELAVAHPAVQHPVHVDVVGLQGKGTVRSSVRGRNPRTCPAQRTQDAREQPGKGPEDPAEGQIVKTVQEL